MSKEKKSMEDIHRIMETLHNKRDCMSTEEIIRDIKEGAEKVKKDYNVNLRKQAHLAKLVSR
ncbi:hypothetical protein BMS3Abin07_00021 [bacterium BMS3Abin07]|nr:hypothetical protein BMS3Abin07_00021 [bacterium BMS3Abin07]